MKVVFSAEARTNLRDIALYIARDNPVRAHSFVQELRETAKDLVKAPYGFPLLPGYESSDIRRKPYQAYLIFYVVREDRILIVDVLHSARDYEGILFPDRFDL